MKDSNETGGLVEIKVGSVVTLNSGGPRMTALAFVDDGDCVVAFTNGEGEIEKEVFPRGALQAWPGYWPKRKRGLTRLMASLRPKFQKPRLRPDQNSVTHSVFCISFGAPG
jgi:uncharacterized protein YodC (DUF2158 family)